MTGPNARAVVYKAEKLGVSRDVLFVGKQGKIADYLGVSDVFLLPSELESFGLAALEALACEVPVIATRIGGIPEVVTDGETGYLSDVGDTEKMAEDTFALLENEDLRRAFGAKGSRGGRPALRLGQDRPAIHRVLRTRFEQSSASTSSARTHSRRKWLRSEDTPVLMSLASRRIFRHRRCGGVEDKSVLAPFDAQMVHA